MPTRAQLQTCLLALGFTEALGTTEPGTLTYAGIRVQLLDAPRLLATSARGELVYLAAVSASQLEAQLTELLGYQRPLLGDFSISQNVVTVEGATKLRLVGDGYELEKGSKNPLAGCVTR